MPQTYFPQLPAGPNAEIYNAQYDLRLRFPGLEGTVQTQLLNKLNRNSKGVNKSFSDLLAYLSNRPDFYDGTTSTYCYDSLTGWPCFKTFPLSILNGQSIEEYFENSPGTGALTETPGTPQVTFWRPSSIVPANQGKNIGNEANALHELLHGLYGLEDPSILQLLGYKTDLSGASCRISVYIENYVLVDSPGLDPATYQQGGGGQPPCPKEP